jgi:membrane fusion protein (multidrug efflux system)
MTAMYRLVDDNPLKLRAAVPERYVAEIAVGQRVSVNVEAYADSFPGTVARINPQIDAANRTFQIEVTVPNDDHRLKPGAFARANVQTRVEKGVVVVPQAAVVSFAGVNKVYTVKDGKAQEVPVQLGEQRPGAVEIVKGLKPGEPVVLSGINKLATGVPVTVQPSRSQSGDDVGATTTHTPAAVGNTTPTS